MPLLDSVPSLYFRKLVSINNPRLFYLQGVVVGLVLVIIVFSIYATPAYDRPVKPVYRVIPQVKKMRPDIDWVGNSSAMCEAAATYNLYDYGNPDTQGVTFRNATCAKKCSLMMGYRPGVDPACLREHEVAAEGQTDLFFATAFVEEVYVRHAEGAPCPIDNDIPWEHQQELQAAALQQPDDAAAAAAAAAAQYECKQSKSYLVPGIETLQMRIDHSYQINLPLSYPHAMFRIKQLPREDLLTALVDQEGKIAKSFAAADEIVLTVQEVLALAAANLDVEVKTKDLEFPKHNFRQSMARTTGMDIFVSMDYSNKHKEVDHQGAVCLMTFRAMPTSASRTTVDYLDTHGSTRTRVYSGISLKFEQKGTFKFLMVTNIVSTLSLCLVWVYVPFIFVFYVAMYCLGSLSKVYRGYVYEDINLYNEFNGASSRMLSYDYSFTDLADTVEEEGSQKGTRRIQGVSRDALKQRVDMILEDSEELDKEERWQFTDFIFNHASSQMPSGESAIQLEDYVMACSSNENLSYDDIISFIDADAPNKNILEKFFMDDSLKAFKEYNKDFTSGLEGEFAEPLAADATLQQRMQKATSNLELTNLAIELAYNRGRDLQEYAVELQDQCLSLQEERRTRLRKSTLNNFDKKMEQLDKKQISSITDT